MAEGPFAQSFESRRHGGNRRPLYSRSLMSDHHRIQIRGLAELGRRYVSLSLAFRRLDLFGRIIGQRRCFLHDNYWMNTMCITATYDRTRDQPNGKVFSEARKVQGDGS